MQYVVAGIIAVGAISLVNLLLTFGVIRRLREHSTALAVLTRKSDALPDVGARVGEFATTTIDGLPIARDHFAGETVVGFFSPGCSPCEELLPEFVRFAGTVSGGREHVLAVMVGPRDEALALSELRSVSRVVLEDSERGAITSAFRISGFPTLCVVNADGQITSSGLSLADLQSPSVV